MTLREIDGNVVNLNPDVGLEIFNNENNTPWKWTQEKISGTNFNVDTNGDTYEINDLIPVLTLGEFHYIDDQSQDVKVYGLLVRNQDGVPTLYTDEDGDLTMTGNITANNGFLKRLYLETVNRTSYLGTNKDDDATISADDILISFGKTKNNGTYSPGKFIVRADGKYFGELAALNYVNAWDSNSQASYSNENTEPNQNAYAILLGPHSEGSGASQINYIMSVFNSNTQTVQTQRVFDIRDDGTVDLEGVLNARNGVQLTGSLRAYTDSDNTLSYIEINGEDGTIGHSTKSWFIDETGYAEFQNARIRGKLSTIVFEKEKVSMIGGDLVISPTFYIEKEIREDVNEGWDVSNLGFDNYYIPFTGNDNPNQVIFYVATSEENNEFDGQYYFGTIIREGTQEPYSYFLDNSSPSESDEQLINKLYSININPTPYHGSLTEGSNIVLANLGTNVIRLTANQTQGATIKVMGSLNNDVQSQLGWINFDGNINTTMRQVAQGQYGLYSENAFLEGKLYLPQVGLTNDNELPAEIDLIENPYIRLSQEIEFSSSFNVDKTSHSDFINFYNIFGSNIGYAVLKIEELYYLISVTPLITSSEVSGYIISFPTSFSEFPVDEIQSVYNITLQSLSSAFSNDIPVGSFIYKMPDTFLGHVIRFWAGQDPAYKTTAPFIITQEGSLYANKGYFKGTVISNNAILGQDNGIGGTTDYIRVMMGTEGLTSIEIQSKQLDNRFNELNTNLRVYTDNRITETKTYIDEQIGITNNRVAIAENDLSILHQYITFPPDTSSSYTELRSNGNITLRLTDNLLSIRNDSLGTSQPNDPLLTYWEDKMQINQYGIVIGNFGWVRADSGNLQLKKVR